MASPATEILGPWPAANPAIRSLSHKQQAGNVSRLKDVGVGVVAHDFVIFDDVPGRQKKQARGSRPVACVCVFRKCFVTNEV
jgi:hypothetical protein